MTKLFNKFKKLCFRPIFGAKIFFPCIPALSSTVSYMFLAESQKLEKNNGTIPRKRRDRRNDERKDWQTLFYKNLLANAGGPANISNQENWFRTNDKKYEKITDESIAKQMLKSISKNQMSTYRFRN